MATIEERNARRLKEKYGDNFLINHLRSRGAPTTIRRVNQLYGIYTELESFLQRDGTNQDILNDMDEIRNLRYGSDSERAINLFTNLGVNYVGPPRTEGYRQSLMMPPEFLPDTPPRGPPMPEPPRNVSSRQVEEVIDLTANTEAPKSNKRKRENEIEETNKKPKENEEECPICLDPITRETNNVITQCGHKFHRECYERIQPRRDRNYNMESYYCPMCRAPINTGTRVYIPDNKSGGKTKRRQKHKRTKKNKSKNKKLKRKTMKKIKKIKI